MGREQVVAKAETSKSLLVPCATVFISSFCIMVLELVAGRLLARHLGASLYTWTSVIGVVLGGITIGNYLGGLFADRFRAAKTLALLFAMASASCVLTIVLNNLVGKWTWLWQFSWPVRSLLHVSFVFLLPSTLLGTISPVVAKMALDRGLPHGRTVGDIYAWSAIGSIAGTFTAGYFLIASMGTTLIIWAIGAVMTAMALLYGARLWTPRALTVLFLLAGVMGICPWQWTVRAATELGLRKKPDPAVLYEDETQYCYVAVGSLGGTPEKRAFIQDNLTHSAMLVGDITQLQYSYEQIMAAVTHRFSKGKDKPSFLILGGGGYVFPRYLQKFWPDSIVDVVEIDPGVTEAAIKTFGLEPTTTINTISLDARNYVDGLIAKLRLGQEVPKYDFIYEDALNHYSVPFQLTTREFDEKVAHLLTDDGIYMVELIDIFTSGRFVGAVVNTLRAVFPFVFVISEKDVGIDDRNTFVVIAAKHNLDLRNISEEYGAGKQVWYLDDADMAKLQEKSGRIVLTDDYAPVENLLAPVVRKDANDAIKLRREFRARALAKKAEDFAWSGNLPMTLATVQQLNEVMEEVAVRAYGVMAAIFTDKGKENEAIEIYRTAFRRCDKVKFRDSLTDLHYDFAMLLKKLNRPKESAEEFSAAAQGYRDLLDENPQSIESLVKLGSISMTTGDFTKAAEYFQSAVDLKPGDADINLSLIQAFYSLGQLDASISASRKAIEHMVKNGQEENAAKIREYLEFLEFRKSRLEKQ